MGKALLIIVLGAGFLLARSGFSNQLTEKESRKDQVEYENEVLAREIARSGFNVAMGIAREHPNAVDAAVYAIDMSDGVADGKMTGTARGGTYAIRAQTITGHSLKVTASGYFGGVWEDQDDGSRKYSGGKYTMWDKYRIRVLEVREDGMLDATFLASVAGYCSSVFMEEWYGGDKVATRMIFPSGHNRDGATPASAFYVRAGTQLNFFIGVDQNCSSEIVTTDECLVRTHMMTYDLGDLSSDWNYTHNALDIPVGAMEQASESVWALVEQLPTDRQRWRIAFEDIHNTSWDNPTGTDPRTSIQAFKVQGYDTNNDGEGNGWDSRDGNGYRTLAEGGLDLNDQQIEISIQPLASGASRDSLWYEMKAERDACAITSTDGMPPEPNTVVCHNGSEREVSLSSRSAHIAHGDTDGPCPTPEDEEMVEVCHDGNTHTHPYGGSQLQTHLDHGDQLGACPEPQVSVCHSGETQSVDESHLQSHLDHGDTAGDCPSTPDDDPPQYDCPCTAKQLKQHKVGILHRPPGNPANEHGICIARSGWENGHEPNHDDLMLCGNN